MPVAATPAVVQSPGNCCTIPEVQTARPLTAVSCVGMNILSATPSQIHRKPVLKRMRSIKLTAGQKATLSWQMHDENGNPVDLSSCVCDPASDSSATVSGSSETICPVVVKFRLREHLAVASCVRHTWQAAVTGDGADGQVTVDLPANATGVPGVYFGEMAVVTTDPTVGEAVVFSNIFYVIITSGAWAHDRSGYRGPPTIMEVRLHLRDSGPEENFLLDNLKFDDAEIALAIVRPVQQWNEQPPDLGQYTTQTFPYRYNWLEAICGNLFLMAAEQFRANNLTYSAAGVQVNDQDKEPNYEKAAQTRLQGWQVWMRAKKAELNANLGFGGIGSSYGRGGW